MTPAAVRSTPTRVFWAGESHPAQTRRTFARGSAVARGSSSARSAIVPALAASAWPRYRTPPAAAAVACGSAMAGLVGRVMRVAVSAVIGLGVVPGLVGLPARPDSLRPPNVLRGGSLRLRKEERMVATLPHVVRGG